MNATRNPYRIEGPALINVSGGRTSGFMLHKVLEAYDGKLPDDVIPVFCNTGLEHPKTYDFLRDIETNWRPLVWLEYQRVNDEHSFKVVNYETASRNGEPFADLIKAKGSLPNPQQRFCTSELKIRTGKRFCRSLGWDSWTCSIGLRADEPRRVAKIKGDTAAEEIECPMYAAGHDVTHVLEFWKNNNFDLQLPGGDNSFGNCSLCFLKTKERLLKIMKAEPDSAEWWIKQESRTDIAATGNGKVFRLDRPKYEALALLVKRQGWLFDDPVQEDGLPCNCTD